MASSKLKGSNNKEADNDILKGSNKEDDRNGGDQEQNQIGNYDKHHDKNRGEADRRSEGREETTIGKGKENAYQVSMLMPCQVKALIVVGPFEVYPMMCPAEDCEDAFPKFPNENVTSALKKLALVTPQWKSYRLQLEKWEKLRGEKGLPLTDADDEDNGVDFSPSKPQPPLGSSPTIITSEICKLIKCQTKEKKLLLQARSEGWPLEVDYLKLGQRVLMLDDKDDSPFKALRNASTLRQSEAWIQLLIQLSSNYLQFKDLGRMSAYTKLRYLGGLTAG